ncbi:S-layer homology domain-containing protein [Paenibacillus polysaccharolyticus]|uniref:S-layer homology domain-containing protein n=1 Tax=Paenibacillus polysaccharolyticus TaxID=582692 RepID=UPI00203D57A6|nr:S-layer homology domain-containing protein [Paenibacillus polysaccharolyticus]MCM3135671.1 S-layer homology domain-containing protein [Paenibacillus polysaccharolyticus]
MNYSRWHMLLITLLSFSLFATSTASAATTTNAKKYKWAKPAVEFMASHGVMQSYEQEADRLNQTVSKAELTQMIHTLFKEFRVEPDKKIEIPGVPEGSTYYSIFRDVYGSIPSNPLGMIAAADQINYNSETFTYQPSKSLSRWDLLIALNALFPDIRYTLDEMSIKEIITKVNSFRDIPKRTFSSFETYDKWKFAYQPLAPELGIIQEKKQNAYLGSDFDGVKTYAMLGFSKAGIMKPDAKGKFYPNQKVTLAETVVILQRIYNFYGGKGYKHQPTKDELIPRELIREYVYRNSAHGSLISDNVALVSTDNISTAYLAISATEPVDLKVIVNGESITYSYEQLSVLDAPIMIAFDGADYAEVYPILRRTGKPIVDQGESEGNEFFEKLDLFFYFSGKWTDFSVFNTLWEDESYEELEQ